MRDYYHYSNLKQRLSLDIKHIINYKFILYILSLLILYYLDSMFFNIFLYIPLYILFINYIFLFTDILFLDILFYKFTLFQKFYKNIRKILYFISYKIFFDIIKFLKSKIKKYFRILKGHLSRGWSEYNFTTLFWFLWDITKKISFKISLGFKRLRRKSKKSIFWKYIYLFYYTNNKINICKVFLLSHIFDLSIFISKSPVILYNFIALYLSYFISNIKYYFIFYIFSIIKLYYFKIYYNIIYYYIIKSSLVLKYILHNKNIYNFTKIYIYFYIINHNIINLLLMVFMPKIIIVIKYFFNKYIFNYNNDYTLFLEKYKYLKDYYLYKFLYCFEGYFSLKTDRYLFKMLYKFLHLDIMYQLTLSFLAKAKKNKYVYNYFYR